MVQAIKLAQQKMRLHIVRLQLSKLLVLPNGQLQHLARLRALHISQRTQIDLAQQRVRLNVVGILGHLVLRGSNRLADAADLEVEIRQTILQQAGVRIGVQRQLVLLHRLGRIVRPARVYGHIFVEPRQTIVVVRRSTIRLCSRGSRLRLAASRSLRNHRVRRKKQGGNRNQTEE